MMQAVLIVALSIPTVFLGVYLLAYFGASGWYYGRLRTVERYYKARLGQVPLPATKETDL